MDQLELLKEVKEILAPPSLATQVLSFAQLVFEQVLLFQHTYLLD
jgi:hypothetical protein